MNHNLREEKITAFVRNVLGCGCPDEVFNKIEVSEIDLESEIAKATRIVIGDTLLIYILPVTPVEFVAEHANELVVAGKQDRDSHGYNRFRLVAHSSDSNELEEQATAAFSVAAAGDEKLHLHFVAAADLAWMK